MAVRNERWFCDSLREQTSSCHHALEEGIDLTSMDHVTRYLVQLVGWLRPVEAALRDGEWPEALDMESRCRKASWIESDLALLGVASASDAAPAHLPRCAGPARWGVAYVIEGATLGGLVIQRRCPHVAPLRFFRGYGTATGARWRMFRECLEVAGRAAPDIVIRSAKETFDTLREWLGR